MSTSATRGPHRYVPLRPAAASAALQSSSQPCGDSASELEISARSHLERSLGADLSGVRIHSDAQADHLARSTDALAFTTGRDIFFRSGAYDPQSPSGMWLLAHEATHIVQQQRAGAGNLSFGEDADNLSVVECLPRVA